MAILGGKCWKFYKIKQLVEYPQNYLVIKNCVSAHYILETNAAAIYIELGQLSTWVDDIVGYFFLSVHFSCYSMESELGQLSAGDGDS